MIDKTDGGKGCIDCRVGTTSKHTGGCTDCTHKDDAVNKARQDSKDRANAEKI